MSSRRCCRTDSNRATAQPKWRRGGIFVEKCTFCSHRVDQGLQPACVEACPTQVITFGDVEDPHSAVARERAKPDAFRINEQSGADPIGLVSAGEGGRDTATQLMSVPQPGHPSDTLARHLPDPELPP